MVGPLPDVRIAPERVLGGSPGRAGSRAAVPDPASGPPRLAHHGDPAQLGPPAARIEGSAQVVEAGPQALLQDPGTLLAPGRLRPRRGDPRLQSQPRRVESPPVARGPSGEEPPGSVPRLDDPEEVGARPEPGQEGAGWGERSGALPGQVAVELREGEGGRGIAVEDAPDGIEDRLHGDLRCGVQGFYGAHARTALRPGPGGCEPAPRTAGPAPAGGSDRSQCRAGPSAGPWRSGTPEGDGRRRDPPREGRWRATAASSARSRKGRSRRT